MADATVTDAEMVDWSRQVRSTPDQKLQIRGDGSAIMMTNGQVSRLIAALRHERTVRREAVAAMRAVTSTIDPDNFMGARIAYGLIVDAALMGRETGLGYPDVEMAAITALHALVELDNDDA